MKSIEEIKSKIEEFRLKLLEAKTKEESDIIRTKNIFVKVGYRRVGIMHYNGLCMDSCGNINEIK